MKFMPYQTDSYNLSFHRLLHLSFYL